MLYDNKLFVSLVGRLFDNNNYDYDYYHYIIIIITITITITITIITTITITTIAIAIAIAIITATTTILIIIVTTIVIIIILLFIFVVVVINITSLHYYVTFIAIAVAIHVKSILRSSCLRSASGPADKLRNSTPEVDLQPSWLDALSSQRKECVDDREGDKKKQKKEKEMEKKERKEQMEKGKQKDVNMNLYRRDILTVDVSDEWLLPPNRNRSEVFAKSILICMSVCNNLHVCMFCNVCY